MSVGEAVAEWFAPARTAYETYGHEVLHQLQPFGIRYEEETGLLECEGTLITVPRHTPKALMNHPRVVVGRFLAESELYVIAFELATALHRLLWPIAAPPSTRPGMEIERGFVLDIESISRRHDYARWDIDLDVFGFDPALR